MRAGLVLAAALIAQSLAASSFDEHQVFIKWATFRYRVNEPFFRSVLQYESGPKGYEAGMNTPHDFEGEVADAAGYCDPTTPEGACQYGRLARRIVNETQEYIFSNPELRADFCKWWATRYYNRTAQENRTYARELLKVYREERKKQPPVIAFMEN